MTTNNGRDPVAALENGRSTATWPATTFHQASTGFRADVAARRHLRVAPNHPEFGSFGVSRLRCDIATEPPQPTVTFVRTRGYTTAFCGLLAAGIALTWPLAPAHVQTTAASFGALTAAATLWPAIPARAATDIPRTLHWAATVAAMSAIAMTLVLFSLLAMEATQ